MTARTQEIQPLTAGDSSDPVHEITGTSSGPLLRLRQQGAGNALEVYNGSTVVYSVDKTGTPSAGGGSSLQGGTAFPGSPADGDWFYRTDRNILYFWSLSVGRWLTVNRQYAAFDGQNVLNGGTTAGNTIGYWPVFEDVYVESFVTTTFVSTTNNGSNFYGISLTKTTPANSATTMTSFDTSADAASNWVVHNVPVNALVLASTHAVMSFLLNTKTGTPGGIFASSILALRQAG
jgi:hypothetical protein